MACRSPVYLLRSAFGACTTAFLSARADRTNLPVEDNQPTPSQCRRDLWRCSRVSRQALYCEVQLQRRDLVLDPKRYKFLPDTEPPKEILELLPEHGPLLGRCFVRNVVDNNFLHQTSQSTHCLQGPIYYAEPDPEDGLVHRIFAVTHLGPGTTGHPGVAHGGLVATLLDDAFGCATHAYIQSAGSKRNIATAWLKVEYKAPAFAPGPAVLEACVEKTEGRKVFLRARFFAKGPGGASTSLQMVAEGTALFVQLRDKSMIEERASDVKPE